MNRYAVRNNDLLFNERLDTQTKAYVLKFRDIPTEDKPREKLLKYGPAILSVSELVAIVLASGTKKEDVLAMSNRVLKEYGEHTLGTQTNAAQMAEDLDIPLIKALQLVACGELGRRFFQKKETGLSVIRNAADAYQYFHDMRNLPKEHLRGIYLNTHYRVIHDEVISIGTIDANLVHPREVFKPAIEYGAAAVILAHNHPSGSATPSQFDIEITQQLIAASKIIGITIIDHIIVTKNRYTSIDLNYD